ncbi:hypothetical protein LSTR_LSTR001146 [Laodelphax striatellus]|uniref:Uncharacterized protein n=1 Tax=Laodelphax striatellus TaxID=195883 RepID=A0A482X196_LAOST|nr:hypothetical protein LSTR_LSTR001146 [Laodelphax striatellus]
MGNFPIWDKMFCGGFSSENGVFGENSRNELSSPSTSSECAGFVCNNNNFVKDNNKSENVFAQGSSVTEHFSVAEQFSASVTEETMVTTRRRTFDSGGTVTIVRGVSEESGYTSESLFDEIVREFNWDNYRSQTLVSVPSADLEMDDLVNLSSELTILTDSSSSAAQSILTSPELTPESRFDAQVPSTSQEVPRQDASDTVNETENEVEEDEEETERVLVPSGE